MESKYSFLGIYLDAGSWAEWFGGIASFAAVAAALLGYWIVAHQRRADEKARDVRAAVSTFWKAVQVFNDTANIAKHFKASLEGEAKTQFQTMRFSRVRPLGVPHKPPVNLNPDEVGLLLKANAAEILMNLSDCLTRYESIKVAMQEYKVRHEAIFELMPPPSSNDGALFSHLLTREELDRVLPYAKMLELLLNGIIELTKEAVDESKSVLDRFGPAMKLHFGSWKLNFVGDVTQADLSSVLAKSKIENS